MIWTIVKDGEWSSGFYRIFRQTKAHELWWYGPKTDEYRRLGRASSLGEAKRDAEAHAKGKG